MTSTFKLKLMTGVAAAAVTVMTAGTANATFGMLPHCVGTVKCGMGGAGSAKAGAAVDAAMNPALAAKMGNTYQVNLGWFAAKVRGESTFSGAGNRGEQKSGADGFPNGSLGVNYTIDANTAFNISIVPGGGGASDWSKSRSFGAGAGSATTDDQQVTYEMVYLQPSYAKKMSSGTYGVGAILSRATMKTDSVQGNFTSSGVQDTKEAFYGVGFQIGGVWDLPEGASFGLNLRSPVWHKNTGVYDGVVFTDPIDTPAQATAGFSVDATDKTSLSLDYKWVNWSRVNTIGNNPFGSPTTSAGFGWVDQHIIMLGLEHNVDDALTLRAGFSHANSPIQTSYVVANFLFPAIVEDHFTAGGSYKIGDGMELGASAYVTPEAELYDSGGGNAGAAGSHLAHKQYGFQLSFSNDF